MSDNAKVYVLIHRWGNMDSDSNGSTIVKVSFNIEDLKEDYNAICDELKEMAIDRDLQSRITDTCTEYWMKNYYAWFYESICIEEHEILGGYPIANGMQLL